MATPPVRALRADAWRNREAILSAARIIFEADGVLASIDGIAAAAGVGNATLYRNFPTRDDLLAAVAEDSVRELISQAADLERDRDPDEALREWLYRLAWRLRIWHDLPGCIASAMNDPDSPVQTVTERLTDCTRGFLDRAHKAGAAVPVAAEDVFELVTTVSWGIDRFADDEERARRRVLLATAGIFQTNEL